MNNHYEIMEKIIESKNQLKADFKKLNKELKKIKSEDFIFKNEILEGEFEKTAEKIEYIKELVKMCYNVAHFETNYMKKFNDVIVALATRQKIINEIYHG